MKKPRVSVIIPTYDRAHLLPRAVNSVLNQTFQDFELIIVDDGSTDNTEEVVRKFNDKRIIYLKRRTNKGPSAARNTGIKNSKGEYIAFLDSDDEWLPEKLEKQLWVFREQDDLNLGMVDCNFLMINEKIKKEFIKKSPPNHPKNILDFWVKGISFKIAGAVIARREVFNKVGFFDESMDYGEDVDMWIRIAQQYHCLTVNQPLNKYYIHNESVCRMKTPDQLEEATLLILEKYKNLYDNYPKKKGTILRYFGTSNLLSGNSKKAKEYFIKSIKTSPTPRNILTFLLFLTSKDLYIKILNIKRNLYCRQNDSS